MSGGTTAKEHKCPICDKTFRYKRILNQHMTVHTGEKNHVCKLCKKCFQQKWNLITHIQRVHSKIHPFKCSDCERTFGYSSHFKKHVRKHLLEKLQVADEVQSIILKPFACTLCDKKFENKAKLKFHTNTHDNKSTYVCEKCGRSFSNKYTIADHIKNIHDDNPDGYVCDKCGARFANRKSIIHHFRKGGHTGRTVRRTNTRHVRASTEDKNTDETLVRAPCEVCGKLITKSYMNNHLNTHYKSRVYPCNYCGKTFLEYGHRKNHERTHTGEKPYKCEVCGKEFTQLGNLLTHRKSVHKLLDKFVSNNVRKTREKKPEGENEGDVPAKSRSRKKKEGKQTDQSLDYLVELKKMQDFVQLTTTITEHEVGNDPVQSFRKLTDEWVQKQFQQSKPKRGKLKSIKMEDNSDGDEYDNMLDVRYNDEDDDEYDDVPLSQLLNIQQHDTMISSDIVAVKLEVQDTSLDNDEGDDDDNDIDDNVEDVYQQVVETKKEQEQDYISTILNELTEIRHRMNSLIYDELVRILDETLEGDDRDKFLQVKTNIEKNKNKHRYLLLLFKKYNVPDNRIYSKVGDDEETWRCWLCQSTFRTRYTLCRHLITHQPPEVNPFKCNKCGKIFTQLDNLREHLMVHNDRHRYCCEVCGAGFRHKTNFNNHLSRHGIIPRLASEDTTARKNKFKCGFCEKMCYSKFHMIEHERTHSKLSPYDCKQCGKCFRTKGALNKHAKTHFNIKEHHCSICYRSFSTKYEVNRHMVTHTGEKKFICDCSKTFTQKSSLNKHKMYCVNNETPCVKKHSCTECDKSFYIKHDLERHLRTHDPVKRYKCYLCQMMLKTELNLKRHIDRHNNENGKTRRRIVNMVKNVGGLKDTTSSFITDAL